MYYGDLLFSSIFVSVACAVSIVIIGVAKQSAGRGALGVSQLSLMALWIFVRAPYEITTMFPVCILVLFMVCCSVFRTAADIIVGIVGLLAFAALVFLTMNSP